MPRIVSFSRTIPSTNNIILEMTAAMDEDNKKGVCVQHVCILIQLPCVCFWVFYTVDSVYKPKSYFLFIYPINEGKGKLLYFINVCSKLLPILCQSELYQGIRKL